MSEKKLFLKHFFGENYFFYKFRPTEHPQVLYIVGKLLISAFLPYNQKIFSQPLSHHKPIIEACLMTFGTIFHNFFLKKNTPKAFGKELSQQFIKKKVSKNFENWPKNKHGGFWVITTSTATV